MRKSIAQKIGYPLQDYIRNTSILKTLEFLRESQFWDEERMNEYRLGKLRSLIAFASRNVPYYEKLFNGIKLKPSDINSLSDLQKIPLLTKITARIENQNLIARNFKKELIKRGKTGGTTGTPLLLQKDTMNRSVTWASYYRWYEWMGAEYGDRTATLWGAGTVLTSSIKSGLLKNLTNYLHNHLEINAFQMAEKDMRHIYNRLVRFQPVILKGYLSALLKLAEYMDAHKLKNLRPAMVSTTSENLLPNHRTFLRKVFDTEVFDQYGCGELSAIAYECGMHNGLHINQEHIILEILDPEDKPLFGQAGRVVGTDLDNYVMPFIRYENGDLATISETACTCGINQPLISSILGRSADTLILKNGSSVHGVFLTDIFYELGIFANSIERFQALQKNPGEIVLLLQSKTVLDQTILQTLEKKLQRFFSKTEIRVIAEIPFEETGKFQYIKRIN